jgi:hypothetical protein
MSTVHSQRLPQSRSRLIGAQRNPWHPSESHGLRNEKFFYGAQSESTNGLRRVSCLRKLECQIQQTLQMQRTAAGWQFPCSHREIASSIVGYLIGQHRPFPWEDDIVKAFSLFSTNCLYNPAQICLPELWTVPISEV